MELKKKSFIKQLRLFQLKRFIDDRGSLFLWIFLSLIIYNGDFNWKENSSELISCIVVFVFQIYRLIKGVYNFFIKNVAQFDKI